MEKLLIIGGPTGSGKTALSVEIAKRLKGEIISADSMQIYRGMDIGTGKVTAEEMQGIAHHMLDICDVTDNFSVSDYEKQAKEIIYSCINRGVTPIVVGGTGFYINALIYKKKFGEIVGNEEIRHKYEELAKEDKNKLYQELCAKDAESAHKLHPNDVKRVIRALEVFEQTGKKFSEQADNEKEFDAYVFCLDQDREKLYDKINARVDMMFESGLVEEVKHALSHTDGNAQCMQAIGYKETKEFLDGKISLDEAKKMIKQSSRHYAKRQLTWFKHQNNPILIPSELTFDEKVNYVIAKFNESSNIP